MALRTINDETLSAIAEAIRDKNGKTTTYLPTEMPDAIANISGGGSGEIPEEAFIISGNCTNRFAFNSWNWFIEQYGDKITVDADRAYNMFYDSSELTEIPFDLSIKDTALGLFSGCTKLQKIRNIDFCNSCTDKSSIFNDCNDLREIGTIKNIGSESALHNNPFNRLFRNCYNLRELPQFENIYINTNVNICFMWDGCYSLRAIPAEVLTFFLDVGHTYQGYSLYPNMVNGCYALDEIQGIPVDYFSDSYAFSSNAFSNSFTNCARLKEATFVSGKTARWKNQTIDLTGAVGYAPMTSNKNCILNYNSGITADKEVTDNTTYQALKDDPDWFTMNYQYSRYNHDSAVNTINSLPDCSAYLATQTSGTNTIKFNSAAGELTDGGAINTLTEEEIAVATAKGWTVTLV